jgi:hypothetical protein
MFAIQAKLRKRLPVFLMDWLDGIRATAARAGGGRIGIVIWKPPGVRDDNAVVLQSLKDWEDLHGVACYTAQAASDAAAELVDDDPPY